MSGFPVLGVQIPGGLIVACEYDRPHDGPCIWWAASDAVARPFRTPRPPDTRTEGGKPGLTCGNDPKQGFDSATIGTTETSVPGATCDGPGTGRKPQGGPDDG